MLQSGDERADGDGARCGGQHQHDTLTVTYTPPPDTTAPAVTITTPTSNATHSATTTPLALGGTASDNVGVTQVTWVNDRGGSGTATGTTSWSVSGHRAAERSERADGDGARCGGQHQHGHADGDLHAAGAAGLVAAYAFNETSGDDSWRRLGQCATPAALSGAIWTTRVATAGRCSFDGSQRSGERAPMRPCST